MTGTGRADLKPGFDVPATLKQFAPEVRLHPREKYLPTSVEWYLERAELWLHRRWHRDEIILRRGQVDASALESRAQPSDDGAKADGRQLFLRIPDHRDRLGLPVNGEIEAPCYVHLRAAADSSHEFEIQYWFFSAYNGGDWHRTHEADWEHITIRVTDGPAPELLRIFYSAHAQVEGGWVEPADGQDASHGFHVNAEGKPIVYSARGSHASYPSQGNQRRWWKPDDFTGTGGAVWHTASHLAYVAIGSEPLSGHEWLRYPGRWGGLRSVLNPMFTSHGPRGPAHQRFWHVQ